VTKTKGKVAKVSNVCSNGFGLDIKLQ